MSLTLRIAEAALEGVVLFAFFASIYISVPVLVAAMSPVVGR
jgi:hypothetical protein